MTKEEFLTHAYAMPFSSPSYPKGPYRFINREFFVITYETEMEALVRLVPEPLEIQEPIVKYEFISMPDSTGFGSYTESGQVIPVTFKGEPGGFVLNMFLDDHSPIAGGREIWGFPKKLAHPELKVEKDTLIGTLDYGSVRIATGTMGYKHIELDTNKALKELSSPNFLIKMIPHVDGSVRVCELVRYCLNDITVKGAWTGPGALELRPHALAQISNLPVKRVISAAHILTDLTLPYGEVVYDYLTQ